MTSYAELESQLGYSFQKIALLEHALAHSSLSASDNQRLEFLGDACLGFLVAHMLFEAFPLKQEGELSQLRAFLIKKESLARLAKHFSLESFIRLGPSHKKQTVSDKTLADCFEALVAALYLDGGFLESKKFLHRCYKKVFVDVLQNGNVEKDAKTRLQEYCQSKKYPLPSYRLLDVDQVDEKSTLFTALVEIPGYKYYGEGQAQTKRLAETAAAHKLLQELGVEKC